MQTPKDRLGLSKCFIEQFGAKFRIVQKHPQINLEEKKSKRKK